MHVVRKLYQLAIQVVHETTIVLQIVLHSTYVCVLHKTSCCITQKHNCNMIVLHYIMSAYHTYVLC